MFLIYKFTSDFVIEIFKSVISIDLKIIIYFWGNW